jgi:predicted phage tail protein
MRFAWPALQRQDDEGNVVGYRIDYAIDLATDGGAFQQVYPDAVDGKTTTRYERSRRVDLPQATTGWLIRVRRLTPNQNSNKIADTMLIAGITEVIDAKLRYPNTALLYIEFDAEQFTNIPVVTAKCKARRWMVPSNYDPVQRTYSGTWDGTMKSAWTNNPAWITFGVCTEDRFGLGKRIKSFMVDKWELYRIAQYCDQLVPDGKGGTEPRFLCDMNLQGKADAWSLLRDISAIYRGMTYWAQGQLVMQADMPRAQDFDYVFTRSNVVDGKFSYGSASAKTRYTRALVSYDSPANNYETDVIPFSDLDLQRRYGDRPTELSAIGCTRASEAQRRGKWAILSNNQDRTVSFKTGMEGVIPLPGHIIPVADSLLAGREVGGRISSAAGRVVTLDRDTQAKVGDRLIINLPGGRAEGRTVQSVNGRAVTVTVAYSEPPIAQLQWAIDADDLAIPLYRVLRTKRTTDGDFEITALQFEPSKFAHIDTGARLEERPISVIPVTVVPAPASISLASTSSVIQGLAVATMTISWPAVDGAVGYDVEWRKDSGNWIKVLRTGMNNVDVVGIYAGAYVARVRALSAFDISSPWRNSILTNLKGKEGVPPAVSFLRTTSELFGISIKWGFPAGAEDTQRTELWYGPANNLQAATKLADLAYPQADYRMQQLLAGATLFFWARLVDRTGNIGPFYPVANGVMGQSSSDAGPILEQIKGQIDESSLAPALNGRIDLIDGNGPGSVNARNAQLRKDLEAQIKPYVDALLWDAAKAYAKGDIVRQGNKLYQALAANSGSQPPSANWKDVGDILTDANALVIRVDNLDQKITVVDGKVIATQDQLNQLQTKVNDPVTGLAATANNVTQVNQRVTNVDNKLTAQTERIDGVYAEINAPMAGSDNDLAGGTQGYAGVWSIQSAVTDGDYAQSKLTQTVEAQVNKNYATYEQTTTALVNGQAAQAAQTSVLRTDFEGNKSTVNQQIAVVSDATKTNAQSIGTLRTDFNNNSSAVQTTLKTLSDSTGANATAVTNLQTTVGNHTQQFQQQASINQGVDGKISGTYSFRFKFDVNGQPYSTGVGLGLETGANGQVTSRFVIQADQFAIYNGTVGAAGSSVPFAIVGGQTFIKSTFIEDGTISNAKIGNYIQSNNYVAGQTGWKLFFDGTFEMNGVVPGQGRSMMTNRSLRFWDVNGIKRVQIGDLSE